MRRFLLIFALFIPFLIEAEQAHQEIKLGALMPLTGDLSMQGNAFREGAELGIEQANMFLARQGIKLKLVIEDTSNKPKSIHSAAKKLIEVDDVRAALTVTYPETMIAGGLFEKAKIPSIALWDSSPEIDEHGEYIFALGPWTPSAGEKTAEFSFFELSAKKAVVVHTIEEWAQDVAKYYEEKFENLGGQVVKTFAVNQDEDDFRTIITQIKSKNVDVIFCPITHNINSFYRQLKQQSVKTAVLSTDTISFEHIEQNPDVFEGVYQGMIQDPVGPKVTDLEKLYQGKYHKDLTLVWHVSVAYDSVQLIAQSLMKGARQSKDIKNALYQVKDFQGVSGLISISEKGSSPTHNSVFKIVDTKFVLLN